MGDEKKGGRLGTHIVTATVVSVGITTVVADAVTVKIVEGRLVDAVTVVVQWSTVRASRMSRAETWRRIFPRVRARLDLGIVVYSESHVPRALAHSVVTVVVFLVLAKV